jgi:sulfatase modifying factor 1
MSGKAIVKNILLVAGIAAAVTFAYARGRHVSIASSAAPKEQAASVAATENSVPSCCVVPSRFGTPTTAPAGMVWIPGGEFLMGAPDNDGFADEHPAHRVRVSGFWMDATDVTNAQFRKFVEATGYLTVAERKPDWEELKKQLPPGTAKPADNMLVPASLVFVAPDHPVPLDDVSAWWQWTPGATWRHPEGPTSNLDGRDDHPVVQVSWDDAMAYCKWAGKRLPTEAEWEFAARGGLAGKRYWWGDEDPSSTHITCNIWQGHFPNQNTKADGYERTSPVHAFKPNSYGLYDMAGNVWQWCGDNFRADTYSMEAASGVAVDPPGPSTSLDPEEPMVPKRVTRGGSFLCNESYCASYRVSARRGTAVDSGMSHLGFRCVMSAAPTTQPN